jgi:hypothetical protein
MFGSKSSITCITSHGEEVCMLTKDGRVIRVINLGIIRDSKRWDAMIEGYGKWLDGIVSGFTFKSGMKVFSIHQDITIYHT